MAHEISSVSGRAEIASAYVARRLREVLRGVDAENPTPEELAEIAGLDAISPTFAEAITRSIRRRQRLITETLPD